MACRAAIHVLWSEYECCGEYCRGPPVPLETSPKREFTSGCAIREPSHLLFAALFRTVLTNGQPNRRRLTVALFT